jgi:hypothetical protein
MNTATHIIKLKKSISWYKGQPPDKIPDPGFQISKGFKVQYPESKKSSIHGRVRRVTQSKIRNLNPDSSFRI